MKKGLNLTDPLLLAPCGLYCGECLGFQEGQCGGCFSRKGLCLKYSKVCKIYDCCILKKNLKFCFECPKFPCLKLKRFFNTHEWFKEIVSNLLRIKAIGRDKFLKQQVRRVNKLIKCTRKHGVVHCSQCQDWPCKLMRREPLIPE